MNNQDNHPMDPSNLHQKSEELAMERTARPPVDSADLSPEEMRQTIHELRLQQIELERQNEELRTAGQTQIESEWKYKTLFHEMLDGFALHEIICDEQGNPADYRFLAVNPAFERMTGLKAGAILGRTVLEVISGTEKHWIETYGKVALTGEPVFFENYSAELGKHFEVKAFRPCDGQFICIIQDITERKQADHVLRECEEKISGVLNNVKAVVWSISWPDLTPIYISPSVKNLYDIRKQAFIDNPSLFKELCHPDDKHLTGKAINQLLEEGQSSREYRIIKPDGSIVWIHDKAMFIYDKNHHPVRVDGLAQDITERKQAEEALKLERDSTRNILATVDAMIIALCPEGRITLVNRKACEILGYREDELLGQDWFATCLPHSIDVDQVRAVFKMALAGNLAGSEYYENPVRTRSGEERLIAWHNSSIRDKDGNIIGGLSAGMDITEHKKVEEDLRRRGDLLRESEARLTSLLDETQVHLWVFDGTSYKFFNKQWYDFTGQSPADGMTIEAWMSVVHPDDLPKTTEIWLQHWATKTEHDNYFRLRRHDGVYRDFFCHTLPLFDEHGVFQAFQGFNLDITERKKDEEALKTAHKLLEIKNQEMEQFVYIVSHDLKSPLVTVKTFVGMLQQDIQDGDQQRISDDLNYIVSSTNKIQQLLDALLQYSRIGTVDTPAQTMSVDQQVQNCLTTLAGILQQHQVQVSINDLPQLLHGDPLHFGQIWQNLIENAVKYRGDQARPRIEIGATQEGHEVVFYIRDNGMGIAPEHSERIFNLFSQLNPGSDGSGLGLALVKKIVTIYHGRIWVESDGKGKGSCFYFTLPGALVKEDTLI